MEKRGSTPRRGMRYEMGKTYIQFRCTDGFKEDVEQWADNCGLSVSDYLREAARQKAQNGELNT